MSNTSVGCVPCWFNMVQSNFLLSFIRGQKKKKYLEILLVQAFFFNLVFEILVHK